MSLTNNLGSNLAAKFGEIESYKVGSVKIWRGATVVVRLTDGLAYPAIEDIADTHKQLVVGWSLEVGSPGGNVRVRADGKLVRSFPGVVDTDIGRLALVKDDETVHTYTNGSAGCVVSGRITGIYIAATSVFVDFTKRPLRFANSLYL